jgi:hypothetical protein
MRQRYPWLVLLASVLVPPAAAAQVPGDAPSWDGSGQIVMTRISSSPSPFSSLFPAVEVMPVLSVATQEGPTRACDACPKRRPVVGLFQAFGVNVVFNLASRLRKENQEYKVTLSSWWENLRHGFEWDTNNFKVNQFGHPYQGSLYFNAGRANGLSFWESAPLVAFGSATWEYFGERNHASINDFVTTTMGGIAFGEMFHRTGWLIRDTRLTGRPRLLREILGTAVDPITGVNRLMRPRGPGAWG